MAINKNFVVKHGLEVNTDLILADADQNRIGIAKTNPQYTLDVNGGIGATHLKVSGITTINNLFLDGYVSIGGTVGSDKSILMSTGVGVTWSSLIKNSRYSEAAVGQDTFSFTYYPGSVEVYVNGVRLAPNEFVASDGENVILNDPCFGGELVEILSVDTVPVPTSGGTTVAIGLTVQDEGSTVGTAASISLINFVGAGVTVTSASSYGVDVTINGVTNPPGKTIYVAMNGSDLNDGLTLDYPKRTIEAAVGIASGGDTVKVSPGTYVENNPLVLEPDVSIEGAELRNCIVTPANPGSDLFWVSNGNHLTDLSFQGQPSTSGASVVAFKPLVGVASDRFFDAARMIRYNLDFIASEAVGYLTSTDYRSPAFTLSGGDYTSCKDDVKDIFRAVCYDITRGGNSKCVGAGLSYYNGGTLQHIVGVKTETIDTIRYAAGIAKSCINNVLWNGNYQTEFTQVRDLSMQPDGAYGNQSIDGCANVVSAINSCVGIVTTIIGIGTTAIGTLFNRTYPGNSGIGTTNPNDPSFIPGVGNVTKGPYIRNCTNFIPDSIGMNVNGFYAEPGDKDDMGITGMMSVDSYTQYNQGGIGVKISNGAYAQLVSIFTICDDQAIVTESGGQCDITNSNSSFGTYGLVSDGLSLPSTKSGYHYTGEVAGISSEGDLTISISGIGKERPYSGQAVYFDELYYEVESVTILNGGSGYTSAPTVMFLGDASGPSAINAEAFAEITNGSVSTINLIGSGRNYRSGDSPTVTFDPSLGGISAVVNLRPIYYQVRSATPPSAGISTITLANPLNNDVGIGTTAFFFRQSLQIVSSHSFEYIGAGNTIELARPSKGGVTIQANEVVKTNGGEIVYTSTDQDGNFAIGDGLVIDQATGTIRGRSFERSLLNTVTPFIIALGAK